MEASAVQAAADRRTRRIAASVKPFQLLLLSLAAAVAAPLIGAAIYNPDEIWTLELCGYSGAALAFLTALAWDRHSRLQEEARQAAAERKRNETRLEQEQLRREIEAKRRFGALELELLRLKSSIERTQREQQSFKHFFPDLPTGSWQAASGPLGMIVSDYELMADLSTFYGHVDELRWRLRFKAQADTDDAVVNPMIDTLVAQMADAVDSLLDQVRTQIQRPQVEQVAGAPQVQTPVKRVARRRQFTGAIRAQTPEELEAALARQKLEGLEGTAPAADGTS
jgi:hypothetical protein